MLDTIPSLPCDTDSDQAPAVLGLNEKLIDRPLTVPADEHSTIAAINEAYAACRAVGGDDGFFGDSWKRRVNELLLPSYGLLLLTHDKPAQLARVARLGGIKTTRATEKNPALIAIKLGARPGDTHEEKLCSDWSTVLRCAQAQQIAVEAFLGWVANTTVAECKREVAAQRRAAKLAAGAAPRARAGAPASENLSSSDSGAPRLVLRLLGADGPAEEAVELPEVVYPTLLAALTEPGARSVLVERLGKSLLLLADELRMAESDAAQAAEVAHG